MTDWAETSLGEACELYQSRTIASSELVENGPFLVYGANGVIGRYHTFNHEASQLLVTCRGATCGAVNVSVPRSWINGNAMVVKPRTSALDLKFLEYIFRGGIDLSMAITGAAQPQITRQSLAPIRISFPHLPEQRRIAAILDQADALRAKRRQALAQLDSLTQSIFIEMFGDPSEPMTSGTGHVLADVVAPERIVTYGIVQAGPNLANGVPYIKTGDIKNGLILEQQLARTSREIASAYARSALKSGDIVMSIRATVGTTALVPASLEGANLTQGTARISPGAFVRSRYLLSFLQTDAVQSWIQTQVKGATFREITLGRLRQLPVLVPPIGQQQTFTTRIQAVESLKTTHRAALAELDALFASLQHRAFAGQLSTGQRPAAFATIAPCAPPKP